MSGLRLEQFAAAIPGAPAVSPIDLAIARGETVALLGPSGAGKSSLLRAIAGLVPAVGEISIAGRRVTEVPAEARRAVYLHQVPRLFPHLDVAGNVAFPMQLRGVLREVRARETHALLQLVQLDAFGARDVGSLSGGERQRVALARAVAAAPEVLLLDEPFTALDPTLRSDVRDALARILERATPATILVTHDADEAAALAARIAVLLDGSLVQLASPSTLFRYPATVEVARFLGVENCWPAAEARRLLELGADLSDGVSQLALPARALVAAADPDQTHRVTRMTITRHGQYVEGTTSGVTWVASVRGSIDLDATVSLQPVAAEWLPYDAAGNLIDG